MPDCYPQLNETQALIRDTARRVVERELKPHVELTIARHLVA